MKSECLSYYAEASAQLRDNPNLAPYLIGLAHAWRLVGAIDKATCKSMIQRARAVKDHQEVSA